MGKAGMLFAFALLAVFSALVHAGQVAVVVDNGLTVRTACVEFSGTTTAADIASNSGLSFAFADYGGSLGKAVCRIGATGCDPSSCFCDANYWAFYYSYGSSWAEAPTGVSFHEVGNREVLGFSWTSFPPAEPELRAFSEICTVPDTSNAKVIPAVRHMSVSLPNRTLCAGEPINVSVLSLENEGPIWEISAEPSHVPGSFEREAFYGASARFFRKEVWWNLVSAQEVGKTGTLELSAEKPGSYSLDVSKNGFVQVLKNFNVVDCTPVPECAINADCAEDRACEQGSCAQLSGSCGFIENHKFTEYECCSDSACSALGSGARCEAHACVVRTTPELSEIIRVLFGYRLI
ncbi:MAG: hypothetical protein Q7T16_02030 [Candidatus Burarchaeum sp.]|nr:hypothetical protein [Candidatus Burarchaeum sp.]MDO8339412.1 hypothetical protein [Candidatus Burarchaeum sp.]